MCLYAKKIFPNIEQTVDEPNGLNADRLRLEKTQWKLSCYKYTREIVQFTSLAP